MPLAQERVDMEGSRGTANLEMKCQLCKRLGTLNILEDAKLTRPLTAYVFVHGFRTLKVCKSGVLLAQGRFRKPPVCACAGRRLPWLRARDVAPEGTQFF